MMGFDPVGYEPKDSARSKSVTLRGVTDLFTGAEAYLSIAFLLLCALFFMRSRRIDMGGARRTPQAPRAPRPGEAVPLRRTCRSPAGSPDLTYTGAHEPAPARDPL